MDARAPFDPGNEFDAMAEWFRQRITDTILEANQAAIYRDLPNAEQLQCFMAGALTGVVGACFACIHPEGRSEILRALADYLPEAGRNADVLLELANAPLDTGQT